MDDSAFVKELTKELTKERRWHFYDSVLSRIRGARPDILSEQYKSSVATTSIFFTTGYPHINLGSSFNGEEALLVTLTIFDAPEEVTHATFHELHQHRQQIERELNATLVWKAKEGVETCRIEASRPVPNLAWPEEYTEAANWTADMLIRFSDTFRPYIQGLPK
jgi:hypothetical protein